ncbi:AraC family ligand binding domain-containing protein [Streptomyces sp. NPDC002205]|uniref:AraC family ligand binding domain-containing protein n=1 Tax=Streptomyces sp. NPDC002205 TaxID=3154411 RepID=UPI00332C1EAC
MDQYVLSVVLEGEGTYRDAEGREERLLPGAHTIVPPGIPHWYGTDPGRRWTELFVVFTGPLFDSVAELSGLTVAGPRYPRPVPSIEALRSVPRSPNYSRWSTGCTTQRTPTGRAPVPDPTSVPRSPTA